jgi:exosortase/archaeosortase family protein
MDSAISSNRFSIRIDWGCDGSEPLALFVAAVLAFPAPFRRKIPGILLGTAILAVANLARVVSLFLAGFISPTHSSGCTWRRGQRFSSCWPSFCGQSGFNGR